MDSEEEIRQREERQQNNGGDPASGTNESPEGGDAGGLDLGGDGGDDDGGLGLPIPSISRVQLLVLAAVVVLALTLYLKSTEDVQHVDEVGDDEQDQEVSERVDGDQVAVEDEATGDRINLPVNPDNPLDMDAAIVDGSGIFKGAGK